MESLPLLEARNLKKYFRTSQGIVRAVDGVSFELCYGTTLALVGESGSGKTTTAHVVMGFYTPTEGTVLYKGVDIGIPVEKRPLWLKKEIQIVFQDPATSLNPKKTVKDVLETTLRVHNRAYDRLSGFKMILDIIEYTGLTENHLFKTPDELGGGEKQLVALARALAVNPSLIILDEPTSALDVSAQARVLKTLLKVQEERRVSYLLITHDIGVVRSISRNVAVMYLGKIVELADSEDFFSKPLHPYAKMLMSSVPVMTEEDERILPEKVESRGEIPSPINPPPGCRFHTRCPYATEKCGREEPHEVAIGGKHIVKCWLYTS